MNEITEKSKELAHARKADSLLAKKMEVAAQGQSPRFLIISPITRSSQDLQLLRLEQGDAFHGTRIPRRVLPPPDSSPVLFAGPAAYNSCFPEKRGVILTFESDESEDIINASVDHVKKHPDLKDLQTIVLQVNYAEGRARVYVHGAGRNYEAENWLLSRLTKPDNLDDDVLVIVCSDSRVQPPTTSRGVPMAIQTLGGHVSEFNSDSVETVLLDEFFSGWLSQRKKSRQIIIIAHGNFEGHGPSCGAGTASLDASKVEGKYLKPIIEKIHIDASAFEETPAKDAEERVISLANATRKNLLTYPAIQAIIETDRLPTELISILQMDTVSNVVSQLGTTMSADRTGLEDPL